MLVNTFLGGNRGAWGGYSGIVGNEKAGRGEDRVKDFSVFGGKKTSWICVDMEGCDSLADEVVGAVIRRAARFLFFSILTRNHNDISTKGVVVKMEKIIFFRGYLGSDDDSVWPLAEEYTRCLFFTPLDQRMVGKLLVLQ